MATYKPYRKVSSTEKEEIRIPYSVLVDTPNMSEYTKRASDETITGTWTYSTAPKMDTLKNSKGNEMYHFDSSRVFFGQTTFPTTLRGSLERPQYTTDGTTFQDIALKSDIVAPVADANAAKTYVYYVTGDGKHAGYDIKHPLGADVNVSVYLTRQSIFGETMDELVMVDVYTKPKKVKLVFSSAPSSDMKFKVVITGVELKNVVTFEEESWANIRKIVLTGNASRYWDIGDTKLITSKSGKTYKIRLADLQDGRYEYSDGSGSSKAVFEFVECYNLNNTIYYRMNSTATNIGGWAASEMRSQTMPTLLADLPDDMVAAMSQVKVLSGIGGGTKTGTSSSNNTLFLPADAELFDGDWGSIGLEESPLGQFDYYKANNIDSARIKYVVDETTMTSANAKLYWTRSPLRNDSTMFCGVDQLGSWDLFDATYTNIAIAPIFAI